MYIKQKNVMDLTTEIKARLEDPQVTKLSFEGSVFTEHVIIKGVDFSKEVSFEGSEFQQGLSIRDCIFQKNVSAFDVSFGGGIADFDNCNFNAMAVFRPRLARGLSLHSSTFSFGFEIAPPRDTSMFIDLRYSIISMVAQIKALDFDQPGYVSPVNTGPIEIYNATIEKEGRLEISGIETPKLHLGNLVLHDKVSIYCTNVLPGDFYLTDLRITDKAKVNLDRISLERTQFSGTNIEHFFFSNVTWPQYKKRVCLFEEIMLRNSLGTTITNANSLESADQREKIAENYRQLVLNYEAKRNYELAEFFHIGEMEAMRLKAAVSLAPLLGKAGSYLNTLWLYHFLSHYGTSYRRASLMLIAFLFLFSILFLISGINYRDGGESIDYEITLSKSKVRIVSISEFAHDFNTALAMTLSIATLQKDRLVNPDGISGMFLMSLLLIVVPGQVALLLFALRRRFRRASI